MTGERVELSAAPVNFIGAWYLDNIDLCDDLIRLFQQSPGKLRGAIVDRFGGRLVDPEFKDSTEICFAPDSPEPSFRAYIAELQNVAVKYIAEFKWCNEYAAWTIVQGVNLQFYEKGGGYKRYHTERLSAQPPSSTRHLVFMTYLNDVNDRGGTEFYHQKLIVTPRKGLTLIWPADWTHTHRGIVSPTEEKYIITGWFNFI